MLKSTLKSLLIYSPLLSLISCSKENGSAYTGAYLNSIRVVLRDRKNFNNRAIEVEICGMLLLS